MQISWTDFKTFITDRGVSYHETQDGTSLVIEAFDGPIHRVCRLSEDTDDHTDYVDNYQSSANTSLSNEDGLPITAPTFEDVQGLITVWQGRLYTANSNSTNIFDELVTTQIKIRGGWYELLDSNATVGDYVEFAIVDKDDVLGLFSTYGLTVGQDVLEVKKFVRKEYVNPSMQGRQDFESSSASTVMAGLYMRVIYENTGNNNVQFKVTEKFYEV